MLRNVSLSIGPNDVFHLRHNEGTASIWVIH